MVKRFMLDGDEPRLIISKAGYDAGPNLPDQFKSFDSKWYGTNGIKWVLSADYPTPGMNPGQVTRLRIAFPFPLSYRPPVVAFHARFTGEGDLYVFEHVGVIVDNGSASVDSFWSDRGGTCYIVVFEGQAPARPTQKTDRIIIGKNPYDNRMGFWIAPPNCKAGDLREPHVISSDNDYLKLHSVAQVATQEQGSSGSKYWDATLYFEELPYYPVVFVQNVVKNLAYRVRYPFNTNRFDANIPSGIMRIYKNRVYYRTNPRGQNDGNTEILFMVFRNKLAS